MEETKDTEPVTTTNDEDPASPDTSDNPGLMDVTAKTTLVVSLPGDDLTGKSADDGDAEEKPAILDRDRDRDRTSAALYPADHVEEASVTNDDVEKKPSQSETDDVNKQEPSLSEADDINKREPSMSETADGVNKQPSLQTETDINKQEPSPSEAEAEAGTPEHRVDRQLRLLRQEVVGDTDTDVDGEAALILRRTSQKDSADGGRHEVVMEMETFHRSSTRRDSFVLAIETGAGRETDSSAVRVNADTTNTTTAAALPVTQEQTADKGSLGDVEQGELFMDEESDCWQSLRGYCQGGRVWVICGVALLLLAVVSAIILIPQSLVYVEYYQMALARSRLTGRVDRSRTLYSGCHLLFPDTDLVVFRSTAHHVHRRMEVTSKDGLSLDLQLSLQYFIKGEELGELHREYGQQYEDVVAAVIESEAKNAVVNFTLDQYRLNRTAVEGKLYTHLATVLQGQGDCCNSSLCANSSDELAQNCSSTCNVSSECVQGLHMSLLPQHVQLGALDIPDEINERFLRFALLQVEAEKETLLQLSTVERKLTELLTRDIRNKAHEVEQAARWTSRRLHLEAAAGADLIRERAFSQALGHLLGSLNITRTDQRLALLHLLAYRQAQEPFLVVPQGVVSLLGGIL